MFTGTCICDHDQLKILQLSSHLIFCFVYYGECKPKNKKWGRPRNEACYYYYYQVQLVNAYFWQPQTMVTCMYFSCAEY